MEKAQAACGRRGAAAQPMREVMADVVAGVVTEEGEGK
jgi:hypothetical protein